MKTISCIFMLFATLFAFAQFPKKDPSLLRGYKVKVEPLPEWQLEYSSGYEHFYADKDDHSKAYKDNGDRRTPPGTFNGRTFAVTEVYKEVSSYGVVTHTLQLEGDGETIYYTYRDGNAVYITPIDFTLPSDYYCDYVNEVAKENKTKTYMGGADYLFNLIKSDHNGEDLYGLQLFAKSKANETGKGVTIYLENGKKIVKPDQDVKAEPGRFETEYSAAIVLNKEDIALLTQYKVLKYELYKYEQEVYEMTAPVLQGIIKCLKQKSVRN
ncbi:hypothetical protein [Flavobacterium litorale]|uniref:Uncharacterized protein n=1 Tax=Flavobacterium litorale TaxID=2856519 RepID=A0ABX8V7V2_9FLAO|nr:hypothetical protein [Flavobacterium litorale]QYJ68928.1 hypothetical protein K1I41_03320 [Flavobacterium litorale]